MADFILRPAREGDASHIINIWRACFGDSEAFIAELLHGCGLLKTAVGAELDSELRSCMFAFDGLSVGGHRASYLYALCTQSEYRSRGLGAAVTLYAARCARERGAEYVFLRPGDGALERWYAQKLGTVPVARSAAVKLSPTQSSRQTARHISPEEYLRLRKDAAWEVPLSLLKAQDAVHRHYGGAFLFCGEAALCAEKCGDGLLVREALPGSYVGSAAQYFGAKEAAVLTESELGLPLMLLPLPGSEKLDAIPPLPFTLD